MDLSTLKDRTVEEINENTDETGNFLACFILEGRNSHIEAEVIFTSRTLGGTRMS